MPNRKPPDLERAGVSYGYPVLVDSLILDDDDEALVCRKFRYLGTQNLYHLQCEVYELESKLRAVENKMYMGMAICDQEALYDWEKFVAQAAVAGSNASDRMHLILKVRAKLREYYEAMMMQNQISRIERPERRVIDYLRQWMDVPRKANPGIKDRRIGGMASDFLKDETDLAALRVPSGRDRLSQLVRNNWPVSSRGENTDARPSPLLTFEESHVARTVIIIDVVVAACLLIGPIIGLHFVKDPGILLGMVTGFTVLFVVSMSFMTNARRAETFVATAAYAAVLVVFISGGGTNSTSLAGSGTHSNSTSS